MPVIDDDIHLPAVGNPMRAQQDPIERCSHSEGLFLHVHSQLTAHPQDTGGPIWSVSSDMMTNGLLIGVSAKSHASVRAQVAQVLVG